MAKQLRDFTSSATDVVTEAYNQGREDGLQEGFKRAQKEALACVTGLSLSSDDDVQVARTANSTGVTSTPAAIRGAQPIKR